ncbi:MAG TPA: hypothetical protein VHM30_08080, partial [Gemmatimonadaceae bacterium]|nr:hypothetical protein [Gemmatimonadaceae bacterium]
KMHGTAGWMTAHHPRHRPPLVPRAPNAVSFTVNLVLALPVHRCFEEPVHRNFEKAVHRSCETSAHHSVEAGAPIVIAVCTRFPRPSSSPATSG